MLIAQPLDRLRVITPDTVLWLICSNDVQVEMLRLVQLPLELQVTPAADSCEAAWAWVRLVTASAGELVATTVVTEARRPSRNTTILFMKVHHSVGGTGRVVQPPWRILLNPATWEVHRYRESAPAALGRVPRAPATGLHEEGVRLLDVGRVIQHVVHVV